MDNALSHIDENGKARMVDVSEKKETDRTAVARGSIKMSPSTLKLIVEGGMEKGDVIGTARIAGIMGSKKTSELIPMCHPLMITGCKVNFKAEENSGSIIIEAEVRNNGKTGVEMEALTAVSVAALTIYDMCKAVDKHMVIGNIYLAEKTGGKSGDWKF